MRKIDFLSISPQTFIFQKSSNKTTFGGFLTLIYGLFVLIMAIVYYIDYHIKDKYIISYNQNKEGIDVEKKNDPRYNPTLKFKFDVVDLNGISLGDNFVLIDYLNSKILEKGEIIERKISNTGIAVLYNCTDTKCNIREEDLNRSTNFNPVFHFSFSHSYYDFNLQNDDEPIKLNENLLKKNRGFNPEIGQSYDYFWKVVNVKDEQGILDKLIGYKKEKIGGSFTSYGFSTIKNSVFNASETDFPYPELNL